MGKQPVSAKRLASVMATLAMLMPAAGHALAVGDIAMKSALYQPLNAHIELLSAGDVDLNQLSVKLGSREDFQRFDVARSYFLTKIKFDVVTRRNGTAYIQLTTAQSVAEPFLDFIVEFYWPQGRILREFTVLVDLPVLTDEAPASMQQAAVAAQTTTAVTRHAPAQAARHAAVESGAAMVPVSRHASELTYGPVKHNDTLYKIANAMRPRGVTVDQMMLALLRNNPDAFYNDNVNQLKAGYMLRVDDASGLSAYSAAEAKAEVKRQHNEWRARKSGNPLHQAVAPTGGRFAHNEGVRAGKGVDRAGHGLNASASRGAGSHASDGSVARLREDLLLVTEARDANRQELDELKFRQMELLAQLKTMQQLMLLRDNERQALLAQSEAEPVQAAAELPEPEPEAVSGQSAAEMLVEDSTASAETEMPAGRAEAAPAPVPAVPVPKKETGLLDNPMLMYGGPGVLLFIIVALVIERRRRMQVGFADSILNVAGGEEKAGVAAGSTGGGKSSTTGDFAMDKMSGMSGTESGAANVDPVSEASVSKADDTLNKESENESEPYEITIKLSDLFAGDTAEALEEDPVEADSEADDELPDVDSYVDSVPGADTNEDAPAIETDAADIDPIAKANVFMLYGCYQQAEDALKEALEKEPGRQDIKLKLLEVLFAAGNRESFEQQARDFHDALGDESDPVRARVVTMAEQLCPDSDLFAGDSDEALKDDPEEAASEADDDLLDADFYIDSDIGAETHEYAPAIETDAVDLDPLSKAHVYLTYSRYQQAEDTLNEMLEKEPERHDIKLKLLEVLFAAGNRESFEQQAQNFHDALADESDPMWARVVTMGAQLCPGSDLFAGGSAEASKEDPEQAASETDDDLPDLYFDIDTESIDAGSVVGDAETDEMFVDLETATSVDVAAEGAPADPALEEDNNLEFDLNTLFMSDATETSSDDDAGLDVDPDDIDETEYPARYRKYKR